MQEVALGRFLSEFPRRLQLDQTVSLSNQIGNRFQRGVRLELDKGFVVPIQDRAGGGLNRFELGIVCVGLFTNPE